LSAGLLPDPLGELRFPDPLGELRDRFAAEKRGGKGKGERGKNGREWLSLKKNSSYGYASTDRQKFATLDYVGSAISTAAPSSPQIRVHDGFFVNG